MKIGKIKVLFVFGTRPEAIKMAPVIKKFEQSREKFITRICVTAQHREMLDQVLQLFDIKPHYDLDIMIHKQSLQDLTKNVLLGVTNVMVKEAPNMVLVQGDTTTTFAAAQSAFYLKIPIGHIEAGLRTKNKYSPFPEEINRRLTSVLCDAHFAPTEGAKENLLAEGFPESTIYMTGNTVIDALEWVVEMQKNTDTNQRWLDWFSTKYQISLSNSLKNILVTGHRRESFGKGFETICKALLRLGSKNPDIQIIYPVHLNPNVQETVYSILGNVKNIHLIPPIDYEPFIFLMEQCHLILTDSGGIQEEAPALGKPLLVMRNSSERPEGIEVGSAKLVGTDADLIVKETETLLNEESQYNRMSKAKNPYGDGKASDRILKSIENMFEVKNNDEQL